MDDINLTSWVNDVLLRFGFNSTAADTSDRYVLLLGMVLLGVLIFFFFKYIVLKLVAKIVEKTENKWDDMLLSPSVLDSVAMMVPIIIFRFMVPMAFENGDVRQTILVRMVTVLMVCVGARLLNNIFISMDEVCNGMQRFKGHVLTAIFQILRVLVFFLAGIIIIAVIMGKSPSTLVAGLGASAAILMLVFKDTIVGFVAGVQLSANKMLRVGDWITVPKANANGVVTAVNLNTVKVRNYDNTIVTIPPYTLVSDSFQNWRFMQESDGRRLTRSVNIDVTTIRFCTPEMLKRFRKIPFMSNYLDALDKAPKEAGKEEVNRLTNLGLFRAYLGLYLESLPVVNKDLLYMIRQLQPTESGLPLEIYFFTYKKEWKPFEEVSCDVLEHVYAVVHEFDLRIFQKPSGYDMQLLAGMMKN
ncbi:MAG: mechanosensitive ion channel family protein [Paludibacteraceae bacterium]|nr:mechanosensitive ion channel family protein [Paludibacteraceae bacterium]